MGLKNHLLMKIKIKNFNFKTLEMESGNFVLFGEELLHGSSPTNSVDSELVWNLNCQVKIKVYIRILNVYNF